MVFQQTARSLQLVRKINSDWSSLFNTAIQATDKNRWCGPAYLAAVVEVIGCYEEYLSDQSQYASAINYLKSLETSGQGFQAIRPRDEIDLWTTSLVLRALSKVPKKYEELLDRALVQRLAEWLLEQLKRRDHCAWNTDRAETPMYLARCLHGLVASRQWVDTTTREQIDVNMKCGNERLAASFTHKPEPLGNLKAYTAVLEYLADLTIPAPAGLLFHLNKKFFSLPIAPLRPQPATDTTQILSKAPCVFISHRHKEEKLAKALVALLEASFHIKQSDIRCTSVQPYTIPAGERIPDRVQSDISGSKVVLGILTPETKESSYVLFELGASWGLGIRTIPLLAKDLQSNDIPDPIGDRNSINLTKRADCHQLLENLTSITGLSRKKGLDARIAELIETLILEATALPPRSGRFVSVRHRKEEKSNSVSASWRLLPILESQIQLPSA